MKVHYQNPMNTVNKLFNPILILLAAVSFTSCVPELAAKREPKVELPDQFGVVEYPDSLNTASVNWRAFFNDSNLIGLIDTALRNNQEFNIALQSIRMSENEILARTGDFLPSLSVNAEGGVTRSGQNSLDGAAERLLQIQSGQSNPDPLPDMRVGLISSWEIDIWNKLHNARDAAVAQYASSQEGRRYMQTQLISEIATKYYELLALDNQLEILHRNIEIQTNALEMVKLQKQAARVTELAVRKFQAEVFHTRSLEFNILQRITEVENELKVLTGVNMDSIPRGTLDMEVLTLDSIHIGMPIDLISNRADIRQAEYRMIAADLNVSVARKSFYPNLELSAGAGLQSATGALLFSTPSALMYNALGGLSAPLLNRRSLTAELYNADVEQRQSALEYDRTVLGAFMEVNTQIAKIRNISSSLDLQAQEVDALNNSVSISFDLFRSARADYMEVLLTQRDALRSKFEWVDTKRDQLISHVDLYRSLGGGWVE